MKRHIFEDMPLAIIGMSCRLPGAEDLAQYWQTLVEGKSGISELPPERLDTELYYSGQKGVPGKTYSKLGGVVPERPFDQQLCPIPDHLITSSDATHLTMLEVAAEACRHAGLDPLSLPIRNTGVFIGHARSSPLAGEMGYSTHIEELARYLQDVDAFKQLPQDIQDLITRNIVDEVHHNKPFRTGNQGLHTAPNGAAAIISEAFGLTGPYMAVDAACASSLYAIGIAANALCHERIEMAIVGGASYCSWQNFVLFSHAQALSAKGSFPFDSRADGFISSDGYAAILIKTLGQALADGDTIYGVIRGMGMSCDGRGKSLWAPLKEGQVAAIRRAYSSSINPARIQYVEAHGTSTQVGDATEIEALSTVFGDHFSKETRIPISSSKANIGHTRETAGLAGLIKVLLAMQHETIPPAMNFLYPNPRIDWQSTPFFVPTSKIKWPIHEDGYPRCAAVDSFGIGGLNVHLVVEQYPTKENAMIFTHERSESNKDMAKLNKDDDAIAVIGMGAIFPGARTLSAFWDLMLSGHDPKSNVSRQRWDAGIYYEEQSRRPWRSPTQLGGFITDFAYDWKRHKIPPRQLETADPLQFMLLDAVEQALCSAGYQNKPFDRSRVGVVVGTIFSNDFSSQLNLALHLPELERDLRKELLERGVSDAEIQQILEEFREVFLNNNATLNDETGSYTSSTLASRIAKTLDLMGGGFALDAGEASSIAALCAAVDLLQSKQCDMMICACGQRAMDITMYEIYSNYGLLSPGTPDQPFDGNANGFVLGEGAGVLLLKRLKDARKDGDHIYAVIRGIGAATHTNSIGKAVHMAIDNALPASGVDAKDVAMVETAGTGVKEIDRLEADALADIYGAIPRKHPLFIGMLTAQIGHTLGASGMASLIKAILVFQNGEFPSSLTPLSSRIDQSTNLRLLSEPIQIPDPNENSHRLAGITSLAFRGLAYHVLIEQGSGAHQVPDNILRLSGENIHDLLKRLSRLNEDTESLNAVTNLSSYNPYDKTRLGIVYTDIEELSQKLKLASSQIDRPELYPVLSQRGIFCHMLRDRPPRLAFIFSGQGSQYIGMLRELVNEVPAAAYKLREIDNIMSRLGYPRFSEIAWTGDSKLGSDVWLTQISVLIADTICYAALRDMGIIPSVISGHSYGEYPALVASGALTLEQAIKITTIRCSLIKASDKAKGKLLSTTAPVDVVSRLAKEIKGNIFLANHNAPDQTIVGGDRESISEFDKLLESNGLENKILSVPSPFHTPLMADVKEPFHQALEKERFLPPNIPFLSSVTNRYTSDPLDIRQNLANQLTKPLRYVDLIERLVGDEIKLLVEVGPRQILTRLHRRILKDRDIATIACDNPKRPGKIQLTNVQALLECQGVLNNTGQQGQTTEKKTDKTLRRSEDINYEIIYFDATQNRKKKMRRIAESTAHTQIEQKKIAEHGPSNELESFLVNFVCEQTGYPTEVIDLDADLEADLGIDSIKKAQLFGELSEYLDIQIKGAEDLSLDKFLTLRHIVEFIRENSGNMPTKERPTISGSVIPSPEKPTIDNLEDIGGLNIVRCSGTPYEMGRQHAQQQYDQIEFVLGEYRKLLGIQPGKLEDFIDSLPVSDSYFDQEGIDELRGIADVIGRPIESLIAYNLGLYPEYGAGCTQFAITGKLNGSEGLIHGVNEDCPLTLRLKHCLTRIVQLLYPSNGIPHVIVSFSGQLGGLIGINAHGIAISSTILLDRPFSVNTSNGKIHPVLVKTILKNARDIEAAVDITKSFQRIGALSVCISHHPADRIVYIEYDGPSMLVKNDQDVVMSTNHCLMHKPKVDVPKHSLLRLKRLQSLLENNGKLPCSLTRAKDILRDRYDLGRQRETTHATMNTIQRVDNQVSAVMRPSHGELWVTPGPSSKGNSDSFYRLDLSEVFQSERSSSSHPHDIIGDSTNEIEGTTISEEKLLAENDRIMNRFILRMIESQKEKITDHAALFQGPVFILGKNVMVQTLSEYIRGLGVTVLGLPISYDHQETIARLDQFWNRHPIPHVFIMTAFDEDASGGDIQGNISWRQDFGMTSPYLVCQHWIRLVNKENLHSKATLVAVTALGGDFGFSGGVNGVEGGGLAGLFKGIRREYGDILIKIIDVPHDESPKSVAISACNELAMGKAKLEVGYVHGRRRLVQAIPQTSALLKCTDIPQAGVWVVTGGGRGISAFVARELGRRFGLRLHLIGTSTIPEIDEAWLELSKRELKELKMSIAQQARRDNRDPSTEWQRIEKAIEIKRNLFLCQKHGVSVAYHSCDISNEGALSAIVDKIRKSHGPIQGIIHGAGIESAARYEHKRLNPVRTTINAKVVGAAHLMNLTRKDPLKYFIGFGSVSGRYGGLGQTDYSMASDMLAKLIQLYRALRPECTSVCIHWPAWGEIGMAMRPESRLELEARRQKFMPPLEGVEHLIDELRAGGPEGEIVIIDCPGTLDLDGIMPELTQHQAHLRKEEVIAKFSIIDGLCELQDSQRLVAEANFDPTSDPFLTEHQFQGLPILPIVVAIETMAQAVSLLHLGKKVSGIRQFEIKNGLRFFTDRPQNIRASVVSKDKWDECEIYGDFRNREGKVIDPHRLYYRGMVELGDHPMETQKPPLLEKPQEWHNMQYIDENHAKEEGGLYHGPRLRCLEKIVLHSSGGWGQICAPKITEIGGKRADGWIIPAAALDACLVACGVFGKKVLKGYQLPQAFGLLRLGRLPREGEICTLYLKFKGKRDNTNSFDFTLFGDDGGVIFIAEDHRCVSVSRRSSK